MTGAELTGVELTGVELTGFESTGVELTIGAWYGTEGRPVPTTPVPVPVGPTGTLLLPIGKGAEEGARTGEEAALDDWIAASLGAATVTVIVLARVTVTVDRAQVAPLSPGPPGPEPGAPDGEEPEPAEPDAGELPTPPAPDVGELPISPDAVDAGRGTILIVDWIVTGPAPTPPVLSGAPVPVGPTAVPLSLTGNGALPGMPDG